MPIGIIIEQNGITLFAIIMLMMAQALGREIFASHDIYCGLRNKREYFQMRNTGVFDYCIWVDRSDHLPPEGRDSMSLEPWMANYHIDNNGSLEDLIFCTTTLIDYLTN